MAIVLPLLTFVSGIPFMQDHTSPVFATNCLSGSCTCNLRVIPSPENQVKSPYFTTM
jgi:hypothetical protein